MRMVIKISLGLWKSEKASYKFTVHLVYQPIVFCFKLRELRCSLWFWPANIPLVLPQISYSARNQAPCNFMGRLENLTFKLRLENPSYSSIKHQHQGNLVSQTNFKLSFGSLGHLPLIYNGEWDHRTSGGKDRLFNYIVVTIDRTLSPDTQSSVLPTENSLGHLINNCLDPPLWHRIHGHYLQYLISY